MAQKQLWLNPGGQSLQGQAGKPFYHQPGPDIRFPDDPEGKIIPNGCLCNYRQYIYYQFYAALLQPGSDYGDNPVDIPFYTQTNQQMAEGMDYNTKIQKGYSWHLIAGPIKIGCLPKMSNTGVWQPVSQLPYISDQNTKVTTSPSIPYILWQSHQCYSLQRMIVNSYQCCGGQKGCGIPASASETMLDPQNTYAYAGFTLNWDQNGVNISNTTPTYYVCPSKGYPQYYNDTIDYISCNHAYFFTKQRIPDWGQQLTEEQKQYKCQTALMSMQNRAKLMPVLQCVTWSLKKWITDQDCEWLDPVDVPMQDIDTVPDEVLHDRGNTGGFGEGPIDWHFTEQKVLCDKSGAGTAYQWIYQNIAVAQKPSQKCQAQCAYDADYYHMYKDLIQQNSQSTTATVCNKPDPPSQKYKNYKWQTFNVYYLSLTPVQSSDSTSELCTETYNIPFTDDAKTKPDWKKIQNNDGFQFVDYQLIKYLRFQDSVDFKKQLNAEEVRYYKIVHSSVSQDQLKIDLPEGTLVGTQIFNTTIIPSCDFYYQSYISTPCRYDQSGNLIQGTDTGTSLANNSCLNKNWYSLGPVAESQIIKRGIVLDTWIKATFSNTFNRFTRSQLPIAVYTVKKSANSYSKGENPAQYCEDPPKVYKSVAYKTYKIIDPCSYSDSLSDVLDQTVSASFIRRILNADQKYKAGDTDIYCKYVQVGIHNGNCFPDFQDGFYLTPDPYDKPKLQLKDGKLNIHPDLSDSSSSSQSSSKQDLVCQVYYIQLLPGSVSIREQLSQERGIAYCQVSKWQIVDPVTKKPLSSDSADIKVFWQSFDGSQSTACYQRYRYNVPAIDLRPSEKALQQINKTNILLDSACSDRSYLMWYYKTPHNCRTYAEQWKDVTPDILRPVKLIDMSQSFQPKKGWKRHPLINQQTIPVKDGVVILPQSDSFYSDSVSVSQSCALYYVDYIQGCLDTLQSLKQEDIPIITPAVDALLPPRCGGWGYRAWTYTIPENQKYKCYFDKDYVKDNWELKLYNVTTFSDSKQIPTELGWKQFSQSTSIEQILSESTVLKPDVNNIIKTDKCYLYYVDLIYGCQEALNKLTQSNSIFIPPYNNIQYPYQCNGYGYRSVIRKAPKTCGVITASQMANVTPVIGDVEDLPDYNPDKLYKGWSYYQDVIHNIFSEDNVQGITATECQVYYVNYVVACKKQLQTMTDTVLINRCPPPVSSVTLPDKCLKYIWWYFKIDLNGKCTLQYSNISNQAPTKIYDIQDYSSSKKIRGWKTSASLTASSITIDRNYVNNHCILYYVDYIEGCEEQLKSLDITKKRVPSFTSFKVNQKCGGYSYYYWYFPLPKACGIISATQMAAVTPTVVGPIQISGITTLYNGWKTSASPTANIVYPQCGTSSIASSYCTLYLVRTKKNCTPNLIYPTSTERRAPSCQSITLPESCSPALPVLWLSRFNVTYRIQFWYSDPDDCVQSDDKTSLTFTVQYLANIQKNITGTRSETDLTSTTGTTTCNNVNSNWNLKNYLSALNSQSNHKWTINKDQACSIMNSSGTVVSSKTLSAYIGEIIGGYWNNYDAYDLTKPADENCAIWDALPSDPGLRYYFDLKGKNLKGSGSFTTTSSNNVTPTITMSLGDLYDWNYSRNVVVPLSRSTKTYTISKSANQYRLYMPSSVSCLSINFTGTIRYKQQ